MGVSTIQRNSLGQDVPPNAPPVTLIQWTSDLAIFDPYTTSVSMTWGGIEYNYAPYYGSPAPNVNYTTAYRISISGPVSGDPNYLTAWISTASGYVYFDVDGNGVLVSEPDLTGDTFGPPAQTLDMTSDFVGPVATLEFTQGTVMDVGGRGIVITLPTVGQWELQKASVRPRREETR